jgi:deoxyribodipyrimidine photo-lyase
MNIFWFRRDLRIEDNVGLFHALNSAEEVLPIFIFDESILLQLPKDDARVSFIHEQLEKIQSELSTIGKSLAVFHGKPKEVFEKLISENKISAVYTNHDYEPYARNRDKELNQLFTAHAISFLTSKDQVIFEKSEVVKDDGTPYVVYTPYSKKWKENFKKIKLIHYPSEEKLNKISDCNNHLSIMLDVGGGSESIVIFDENCPYSLEDIEVYSE